MRGYLYCARAFVKHARARGGGGSIVNIASVAGIRAAPMQGIYGATKAAVISMTQTLAFELGSSKIRVNAIAPGLVETRFAAAIVGNPMLRDHVVEPHAARAPRPARGDRRRRGVPAVRCGVVHDRHRDGRRRRPDRGLDLGQPDLGLAQARSALREAGGDRLRRCVGSARSPRPRPSRPRGSRRRRDRTARAPRAARRAARSRSSAT